MANENLPNIFNEKNNSYFGHGTVGNEDIINSIFNNGLRCSHNQLYFTSIEFGAGSDVGIENIKSKMDNWPHNDAKKIVIVSLPSEFYLINSGVLYTKSDNAYAYNISKDEALKLNISPGKYIRPEFIKGYYNTDDNIFYENPKYYKKLSEEEQKHIFEQLKQNYLDTISAFGIYEYKEFCSEYNRSFPISDEEINSYINKEKTEYVKSIIREIPSEILNKQIKLKDNTLISFEMFLYNYMTKYLIDKEKIVLNNGVSIPIKHYIQEVLLSSINQLESLNNVDEFVANTMFIEDDNKSFRR